MFQSAVGPEALAARTARAVAAAVTAGRALGVAVSEAKVVHDVFSVVVHLQPSPVVVRAPAVLPRGLAPSAQRARQQRELDAVSWLAERSFPVVRPSPLVPRAPVERDGFSLTFWEYVTVVEQTEADWLANIARVPALHAELRDYPGELPFLSPIALTVPTCLAYLAEHRELVAPEDLDRAQREWRALEPLLTSRREFEAAFPRVHLQAVHGDAPFYNMIKTPSGLLHADFEDVTLGPPELDLALLTPEYVAAYDAAAAQLGARPLDPDVLRLMGAARNLQLVACLALVPELPVLASGLAASLEGWRQQPFAAGFG